MRFSAVLVSAVGSILLGDAQANFHRDVISKTNRPLPFISGHKKANSVQDDLLAKAIPLSEYNDQLKALGVDVSADGNRQLEENADDYLMADEDLYSFSGFSMKYARCQPIQQFSEDALLAGEYSPMVTQDVVILRLCPYKSCSSSRQYGCHYNYAEYAIGLNDYMRVMLRYRADKKERLCEWCAACNGDNNNNNANRKLEDNQAQDEQQEEEQAQDEEQQQDDNVEEAAGDDAYNANNNNNYDEADECYTYSSYCENYYYDCQADGQAAQGDDANANQADDDYNQQQNYLDEDEYYDFLGCTELADQYGGIYFVRPTCDSSESKISMAVFYDEYCSQSASKVANIDSFQVAFDDEVFESMYDGSCMDCSESVSTSTKNGSSCVLSFSLSQELLTHVSFYFYTFLFAFVVN